MSLKNITYHHVENSTGMEAIVVLTVARAVSLIKIKGISLKFTSNTNIVIHY